MSAYELSGNKWGTVGLGTSGGQVTWSFATTVGASFSFDYSISDPAFQAAIQAAFDTWESVANIDFVQVADGASVDIRLGWDGIDGASNVVAQTSSSYSTSSHTFIAEEIRFDEAENWSTDPNYAGSYINFYAVALHEIGHALGLDHSSDPNSIMYAYTGTAVDLSAGDIAGAQAIYGAASGGTSPEPSGPTAGNDVLVGTTGSDVFSALAGNDSITGLEGNDALTGNAGDDTIDGGAGNDQLWAGGDDKGNDRMLGGNGNDTVAGGSGDDTIYGGYGADVLFGGAGNDYVDVGIASYFTGEGAGAHNTAWGGAGGDLLNGDDTSDLLGGGTGDDLIYAYGGNDLVYGGGAANGTTNDDTVYAGSGNDTVFGGVGADLLLGQEDADVIFGGDGNDAIDGGDGNDTLWGGAADDVLAGSAGVDVFSFASGSGDDTILDFDGDRIDLSGQSYEISDVNGDLELTLSGGGTIVFDGLTSRDFDAGWIV